MIKIIIILIILIINSAFAQNLRLELFGGNAYTVPSKVTVRQDGYPDKTKVAHWSTRPLEPAPYYSARIGWWTESKGWDVEMLHHKLYMDNTDSVFRAYQSTFGFNMFLLNRAIEVNKYLILRAGIGPVISHPVNNIRGESYQSRVTYKLVGASAQVAAQSRQNIIGNLFLTEEVKVTYAHANLPIANGDSLIDILAFHGLVGLSYDF